MTASNPQPSPVAVAEGEDDWETADLSNFGQQTRSTNPNPNLRPSAPTFQPRPSSALPQLWDPSSPAITSSSTPSSNSSFPNANMKNGGKSNETSRKNMPSSISAGSSLTTVPSVSPAQGPTKTLLLKRPSPPLSTTPSFSSPLNESSNSTSTSNINGSSDKKDSSDTEQKSLAPFGDDELWNAVPRSGEVSSKKMWNDANLPTSTTTQPLIPQSTTSTPLPPAPSLRILRRPSPSLASSSGTSTPSGSGISNRQKTLGEREEEYRKARERIFKDKDEKRKEGDGGLGSGGTGTGDDGGEKVENAENPSASTSGLNTPSKPDETDDANQSRANPINPSNTSTSSRSTSTSGVHRKSQNSSNVTGGGGGGNNTRRPARGDFEPLRPPTDGMGGYRVGGRSTSRESMGIGMGVGVGPGYVGNGYGGGGGYGYGYGQGQGQGYNQGQIQPGGNGMGYLSGGYGQQPSLGISSVGGIGFGGGYYPSCNIPGGGAGGIIRQPLGPDELGAIGFANMRISSTTSSPSRQQSFASNSNSTSTSNSTSASNSVSGSSSPNVMDPYGYGYNGGPVFGGGMGNPGSQPWEAGYGQQQQQQQQQYQMQPGSNTPANYDQNGFSLRNILHGSSGYSLPGNAMHQPGSGSGSSGSGSESGRHTGISPPVNVSYANDSRGSGSGSGQQGPGYGMNANMGYLNSNGGQGMHGYGQQQQQSSYNGQPQQSSQPGQVRQGGRYPVRQTGASPYQQQQPGQYETQSGTPSSSIMDFPPLGDGQGGYSNSPFTVVQPQQYHASNPHPGHVNSSAQNQRGFGSSWDSSLAESGQVPSGQGSNQGGLGSVGAGSRRTGRS